MIAVVETRHCRVSHSTPLMLFRETYRIESARKPYWDYCCCGSYFVTICTKNRRALFGKVVDDAVNLSAIGRHATGCWQEIPAHHRNVEIDEFIVMPNHVHGIIVLTGPERLPALRRRGQIKQIAELTSVHPQPGSLGAVVGPSRLRFRIGAARTILNSIGSPAFTIELFVARIR